MFNNERYLTCGIDSSISLDLQLFMWSCINQLRQVHIIYKKLYLYLLIMPFFILISIYVIKNSYV